MSHDFLNLLFTTPNKVHLNKTFIFNTRRLRYNFNCPVFCYLLFIYCSLWRKNFTLALEFISVLLQSCTCSWIHFSYIYKVHFVLQLFSKVFCKHTWIVNLIFYFYVFIIVRQMFRIDFVIQCCVSNTSVTIKCTSNISRVLVIFRFSLHSNRSHFYFQKCVQWNFY